MERHLSWGLHITIYFLCTRLVIGSCGNHTYELKVLYTRSSQRGGGKLRSLYMYPPPHITWDWRLVSIPDGRGHFTALIETIPDIPGHI